MPVLAVAHRGDPYRFRENTLASVESALAAGADAVEVDVQLTRDGVPVLLHDRTLERLWRDPRPVGALTLDQLSAIGSPGVRVPTLAEVLKAVGETTGARLLIDLDEPGPVAATLAAVTGLGAESRVAYCGPVAAMLAVRERTADAELALTWRHPRLPSRPLLDDLRPYYVNPPFGLVDRAYVEAAHEAGVAVSTWTVDRRRTMRRLLDAGVDSLTSNRIALLRTVLGARP
ncbi:glycerophosphodiester phosphodiesterase [Kitasatospora atroaurantiaca]|uniref:Glycerophosphoryl diester phosphodiesterase n=1 Tax=Kitasatospora atroaurantiaca TaxID=285545 RepID=A0A561F0V0_9ACTN|nr:glycerophosphodiester phosphodiesterase [Kitasatospora atroaurantiaca]TWE21495.1 glycerophosphoryl diester phosphodiesterase [Kitasatospora atroaurantiaca]